MGKSLWMLGVAMLGFLPARADHIAETYWNRTHPCEHEIRVDNLDDYPDYRFLFSCRMGNAVHLCWLGSSPWRLEDRTKAWARDFSRIGPEGAQYLFAVPTSLVGREESPSPSWFDGSGKGVLKGTCPPVRTDSAWNQKQFKNWNNQAVKQVSHWRVRIQDGRLTAEVARESWFDKDGQPVVLGLTWYFYGVPAAAAILIAAWRIRRRRACPRAA